MINEPPKFNVSPASTPIKPATPQSTTSLPVEETITHIQNLGQTQDSYTPQVDPYLKSFQEIYETITNNPKITKIAPWLLPALNNLNTTHNLSLQITSTYFQNQPTIWQSYEKISEGRTLANEYLTVKQATQDAIQVYENFRQATLTQHNENMATYARMYTEQQEKIDQTYLDAVSLRDYYNPAEESVTYRIQLDKNKEQQRKLVLNDKAITAVTGFSFNQSVKEGAAFVNDFKELMLSYYNVEAENLIVKTEKTRNIETALNTLEKIYKKVKKLGAMISCTIEYEYHMLKKDEIKLAFKFKEALRIEKEEAALRKAEQREAERAEAENQRELDRLDREEQKLARQKLKREQEILKQKQEIQRAIEKARIEGLAKEQQRLQHVIDQLGVQDSQIAELEAKLASVKQAQKKTSDVLANTRAGYVYVISNKGSFGEGVVKIGLTRRVDPSARVNELGDASVPFKFSTHVIHFSENAVQLEKDLHHFFKDKAVNKVNPRKEFFRVHPQEVLTAMNTLSNGTILRFDLTPADKEYIDTLKVEEETSAQRE